MAKGPTPQQKRERRSKMLAGGLGLVLLAVGVIQGPKLMSELGGKKAATTTVAAPATATPVTAALSGATGEIPVDPSQSGQIASFTTFTWRDPFKSEPTDTGTTPGSSSPAGSTPSSTTPPASGKTTTTGTSSGQTGTPSTSGTTSAAGSTGQTPGSTPVTPTTPKPAPVIVFSLKQPTTPVEKNAALIAVNGHREVVTVGSVFPAKNPVFRLLSLRNGHVRIGVIGGKFAGNALALDLHKGTPIVLSNQANHLKVHVNLVKLTSVVQPALKANTAPISPAR